MLEILYEKYILISFSAREDGEKGNGSRQRSYSATVLGGDSFNTVIIVVTWKVLWRVFYGCT